MQTTQQPDNSTATIITIAQEATRGWLEMITECRQLEKNHGGGDGDGGDGGGGYISQCIKKMRFQLTRNYRILMKEIEESKTITREETAKKWIRDNLEEAQHLIDNIVGIKGITEDPLKVAAELEGLAKLTPHTDTTNMSMSVSMPVSMSYDSNVIAANTAGTLQREFVDDKKEESSTLRMSPPHEELYGY